MRSKLAAGCTLPLLFACLACSGCGRARMAAPLGSRLAVSPQRGGILHLAMTVDLRSLDPVIAFDEPSREVLTHLFDPLVDYDADGKLINVLAEDVHVSPDHLRYTFTLRRGTLFHDGTELTADDVKRSIERALHHDTPCPVGAFYSSIDGYAQFHEGSLDGSGERTYARDLRGVVVLGRYALHIDLKQPDATFLAVLTLPTVAPVCKSAGSTYAADWSGHPCGTGAFSLSSWDPGREVHLARHSGYFRAGLPLLDGIEWLLSVPELTQRFKLEHGELDSVRDLLGTDSTAYRSAPEWQPYGQWDFPKMTQGISLNTQMPPFDNVELRRAVASAIDWDRAALLREGHMVRAHQIIPPAVPGYEPSFQGQVYDPEAALVHMRNAGFPFDPRTGKGGYPKTIPYLSNAQASLDGQLAQIYAQQLAKIGIRIELNLVSWPTFLAQTSRRGKSPMGYIGWSMDFPDPSDFFEPILASSAIQDEDSQNASFFSNRELDELLARAHSELDPDLRQRQYHRAEELVRDEAPWAIGYAFRYYEVTQPYVHDYVIDPGHTQDMRRAWLDLTSRARSTTGHTSSRTPLPPRGRSLFERFGRGPASAMAWAQLLWPWPARVSR